MHRRGSHKTVASFVTLVLLAGAAGCSGSGSGSDVQNMQSMQADGSTVTTADGTGTTDSDPGTSTADAGATGEIGTDPNVRIGTLPNGLAYYIRDNDNPGGSAELRLAVDAGSGREDDDQAGVAHFLEHMMFNGTEQFPKNDLIDVLRSTGSEFGADVNAYTSYDETVFQLNVPTRDAQPLDTGLDILAQWLSAATLDADQVTSERGVVLDEWRGAEQSSRGRIGDAYEQMFLGDSVYAGRSPIGNDTAIEAMTPALLRRFYDQWYRPDNAAVVVVGDIDVDDVEAGITKRFAALQPRGDDTTAEALVVTPQHEADAIVVADPDLTSSAIEVSLPLTARAPTTDHWRAKIVDQLAFAMIANRLSDDSSTADAPFDDAYVSDNDLVRSLDAPSVVVDSKSGIVLDSAQALLDEFERAQRFGFDEGELQRAVNAQTASVEAAYDSRDTVQDADYADQYADSSLTGTPIITEEAMHDLATAALSSITADEVSAAFALRWTDSAVRIAVVAPQSETSTPTRDALLDMVTGLPDLELTQRPPTVAPSGELMQAPTPVDVTETTELPSNPEVFLDSPTQLTFANGVTVIIDTTPIVAGSFAMFGRSPGGVAVLDDADVAEGTVAVDVVTSSGVGGFDQAQLDQQLSATSATVAMSIGKSTDEIYGSSSADDLESLMQLIHLYMTSPRVDDVPFEHTLSSLRDAAADPAADPQSAGYDALDRARYGDDLRFRSSLTADEIDSIDQESLFRVWNARFGNASDWSFAIVGDIDVDTVTELARSYLGTLPSTGTDDAMVDIEPAAPAGVVTEVVNAGTGAKADLLRLYSVDVADTPHTAVLADVAGEVVSTRLLQDIREALGESYSPSASFAVASSPDGGDAHLGMYVEISSSPDQMQPLSDRLTEDLTSLATDGPTDDEVQSAMAVIGEQYNLISNEQLCDVLLNRVLGYGPPPQDLLDKYFDLQDVTTADVASFLTAALPTAQFVEVQVVPR